MTASLVQTQGNNIVIDKGQLVMYAIAAAVVVVLIIVVIIAIKSRKKNFIKTVPTNLKDGE